MRGSRLGRIVQVGLAALVGWGVGWVVGALPEAYYEASHDADALPELTERIPLPHHVPEHAGGASLRFAMVHDVLVERFNRHPTEYYTERNRLDRARLAALPAADPQRFALTDDLGVGLERVRATNTAIELLRGKLILQQAAGLTGRDLYTTYANLGTFLIHGSLVPATRGDPPAQAQFREGIDCIREAVRLNPEAHFGRERWQLAIAEFLLAAMADPGLLRTWDFLGNNLALPIETILNRETNWPINGGYGRATSPEFSRWQIQEPALYFQAGTDLADPALWPTLNPIRAQITTVGAEKGWSAVAVPSHQKPAPFDEPTLGIIGMWRQGGGANPHFALALGETMLRVGQRQLAWNAFERAGRLARQYWPDPSLVEFLRAHCRSRQAEIEATLAYQPPGNGRSRTVWQLVSPHHAEDTPDRLRARFDAELHFGEISRSWGQDFDRKRIQAGIAVDDPHFDDGFPVQAVSIASAVGPEEWFVGVFPARVRVHFAKHARATGLCGAGIAALLMAFLIRWLQPRFLSEIKPLTAFDGESNGEILANIPDLTK